MRNKLWMWGVPLIVLLVATPAMAGNLLDNGSFEIGTDPGSWTNVPSGGSAITDWTVGGSAGVDYIGTYWDAQEGSRSVDLSGTDAGFSSQTFATVTGVQYLVEFWMAGNPDGGPTTKTVEVSAAGSSADFTFDITGKSKSDMGWTYKSWIFTATGTPTTVKFLSKTSGGWGPALDNVSVTAVPLPASAWLGLGLLGIMGAIRKLRRRR